MKKLLPGKSLSYGVITAIIIACFLSGFIIDIPDELGEGGIVNAIWVLLILITIFAVTFGILVFFNRDKNKK